MLVNQSMIRRSLITTSLCLQMELMYAIIIFSPSSNIMIVSCGQDFFYNSCLQVSGELSAASPGRLSMASPPPGGVAGKRELLLYTPHT